MSYEFHDFACPDLGKELLKNAKGALPLDVWRVYVMSYDPRPRAERIRLGPPEVIQYCDEYPRSTLDPQKAVDEVHRMLNDLVFRPVRRRGVTSPPLSPAELANGIWEAILVLQQAHSSGRRRGQPKSMQPQAVRAYIIRKFNPHPKKQDESSISWAKLADLLFLENGKCPRSVDDDDGRLTICGRSKHQHDDRCVKALTTAVGNLKSAMKHDRIPV